MANALAAIAIQKTRKALQDIKAQPKAAAYDFLRGGLLGATTDLAGYPVDVATMALRPLGYKVENPVGGSQWLAETFSRPTGTPAETAGRVAMGFLTPGPEDLMRLTGLLPKRPMMSEMTVYHGSPHDFDQFDSSKIGTGEGGQAYGHGLYVAENPNVAKSYAAMREVDPILKIGGEAVSLDPTARGPGANVRWFLGYAAAKDGIKQAELQAKQIGDESITGPIMAEIRSKGAALEKQRGALYHVDLADEHIAKMLDWDKPLSEQPPAVAEAAKRYLGVTDTGLPLDHRLSKRPDGSWIVVQEKPTAGNFGPRLIQKTPVTQKYATESAAIKGYWDNLRGEDFYKTLKGDLGDAPAASDYLNQLGIPGIKYYDGGSRAAGQGTRNYVVFDDKLLKILKKE